MTKIIISDLEKIREINTTSHDKYKAQLMVCAGTGCVANKSFKIKEALENELKKKKSCL